jgi:hypothetical protein
MQLLPSTAERVAQGRGEPSPADSLYDPDVNVALGVAHLADLMRLYGGDPLRATAAYNGGEEAVARWQQRYGALPPDEFVESITYRQTRDYVKKVMGNYRRYQQLYRSETNHGSHGRGRHPRDPWSAFAASRTHRRHAHRARPTATTAAATPSSYRSICPRSCFAALPTYQPNAPMAIDHAAAPMMFSSAKRTADTSLIPSASGVTLRRP